MNKELTAVSLFTGAGGMDVGFERAGIKVVFANELMKEAAQTYNANHPTGVMVNDDIYNQLESIGQYAGADLVFGGPPCQGFSVAGKMNPDDERSKLIFTFLDVVEKVKPRAFVMENVKALGKLEKWEPVRKKYMDIAAKLGYFCVPFVLNATEYNVSQKRERVFFIGIKGNDDPFFETTIANLLEEQKHNAPTIRELLGSLGKAGSESNPNTCTAKITFATHPIMRKSPYAGMYFNGQGTATLEYIDQRMAELQEKLVMCVNKNAEYDALAKEIDALREKKAAVITKDAEQEMLRKRINEMRHFLQTQTSRITEYDEQLVRRLIEKITVYDDKLIFEFKSGMTIELKR